MMAIRTLDIDLLRAFVAITDAMNFTNAAQAVGVSQSAISMRIRKLEDRLGHRLMERDPRSVELTPFGLNFLEEARLVLDVHDRAVERVVGASSRLRFSLAVSDHAAGALLPALVLKLQQSCPNVRFTVTVCGSAQAYESFRQGEHDAAIARFEEKTIGGTTLFHDNLVWTAAQSFIVESQEPLPVISLSTLCSVRKLALAALDAEGLRWREVFTGTGVAAVQAAVSAGLGIACLDARNVPADCRRLGAESRLPPLPSSRMMLHHRGAPENDVVIKAIKSAFLPVDAKGMPRKQTIQRQPLPAAFSGEPFQGMGE